MRIQIHTDHAMKAGESFLSKIRLLLSDAFRRTDRSITRLDVYLTDVNGRKKGENDKQCVLEARCEGSLPVAVSHNAESVNHAIAGAVGKMIRVITAKRDRLRDLRHAGKNGHRSRREVLTAE